MKTYSPHVKIGYLGGGQLARMLTQSALKMGLDPHVLSSNQKDPGARVCGFWQKGNLENQKDLESFLKKMDVTGFESEFLNAPLLIKAKKNTKARIFPSPELMGLLQDRKSQKRLLDEHRLNTALWIPADNNKNMANFIHTHGYPMVFKKRFFGYDGYGTFIVKSKPELARFLKQHWQKNSFIMEKFIPFKKEYAIIVARSQDGSFTHFPFVESFQEQSRCDWVKGPIKIKNGKAIIEKLKVFLKKLHYVGVMGVELFLTDRGLIINEIAPRVHNTGHYSLDTEGPSQFDLHNLCLLGLKLPKEIKIKQGFAMVNLIGHKKPVKLQTVEGLYWYGKDENRRGRKMGHINVLAKSSGEALKKALNKREKIQL